MWEFWVMIGSLGIAALILLLLVIFIIAFQLWMLIDCIKRQFDSDTTKVLWIIVILLFSMLGASVYYLAVKRVGSSGKKKR